MRRAFSIFLILLFGFGPVSAMIDGAEDANLPACCRRNGAHHCAMSVQMMAMMLHIVDPTPSYTAPLTCPYYPGPTMAILMPAHALVRALNGVRTSRRVSFAPVFAIAFVDSRPGFAHAGRGPPAGNLN